MRKLAILALALALASVTAFAGLTPANALPLGGAVTAGQSKAPLVQEVQYRGGDDRWDRRDRWERHDDRREWYNGHRGYSQSRPRYRPHSDDYWYPLASLGAAAIIGGVIANQPSQAPLRAQPSINPRHVADCSARYRSYRSYDNTFQPNYGPRQQCYSAWY